MKVLIKNNVKGLVKNRLFLVLLVIISGVMGFLYAYLYYGNYPMKLSYSDELKDCNLEQMRILPKVELTDDEKEDLITDYDVTQEDLLDLTIDDIISKYDVDLLPYYQDRIKTIAKKNKLLTTLYERKYIKDDGNVYYMTYQDGDIDKIIVTDGVENLKSGEILLSVQFARLHDIEVGSEYPIGKTSYTIAGLYYQPSESLIYNDKYSDNMKTENNAGVLMTKEDFDAIDEDANLIYLARMKGKQKNLDKKIQSLMDDESVAGVYMSSDLMIYNTLSSNFDSSLAFMFVGIGIFAIAVVLILLQIITNQFSHYKKSMGIIKAMGFSDFKISLSFFVFGLPIALGVLMGVLIGYSCSEGYALNYLMTFNYVNPEIKFEAKITAILFCGILLISMFICCLKGYLMVVHPALDLIFDREDGKVSFLSKIMGKIISKFPFVTRLKIEFMSQNVGRILVMLIMTGLSFIMLNFAVSIYGLMSQPVQELDQAMNYKYIYNYDEMQKGDIGENRAIGYNLYLLSANDSKVNKSYTCYFVNSDFVSMNIQQNGKSILKKLKKNCIVITEKMASEYNMSVGDKVKAYGVDGESISLEVVAINPLNYDSSIYVDMECVGDFIDGIKSNKYNVEFANKKLKTKENVSVSMKTKKQVIGNVESTLKGSMSMIPVLIIITAILVISMSVLLAYLNVKDNKRNIAVFMINGYRLPTIMGMVINVYSICIFIGSIIGALVLPNILQTISGYINGVTTLFIQLDTQRSMWIIATIVLYVFYRIALFIMSGQLKKIKVNEIVYE